MFMDFFYVNGNIFMHTKSDNIDFLTAQYCTSISMRTIITALETIISKYTCRSLNIHDFHRNNEFDKEALRIFYNILCYTSTKRENMSDPLKD